MDTDAKIKQLEAKFTNLKFNMEEKDKLAEIFENNAPGEATNIKIAEFLK